MPRVSVVIPTYNYGRFIGETIQSVLNQAFSDFELIVIDDGSTDNTRAIVNSFSPNVRYFHQENQGVSAARNRGIELSEGEYIIFLDADDVLLADALEKSVTFLDQHPEVGFCCGQFYTIDEEGKPRHSRKLRGAKVSFVRDGREQIERMLFRVDITPSAVLIRRCCFEEVGLFDTSLTRCEDIDMWLRIAMKYAVGYLAEPQTEHRVHPLSITAQGGFKELEKLQHTFVQKALESVESIPYYSRLRRKAYFGLYCYLAEEAAQRGFRVTGFRYLLKALRACPELLLRGEGISFLMRVAKSFLPRRLRRVMVQVLVALKLR